jgi:uncharacterized membrane protein YccC
MERGGMKRGLWQNPTLRHAVQGGLAIGLSIVFGTMLSGRRWYWAAITAFIIDIGVGSRDEALVKALQRVGGTVIGIAVGIGLAMAVSGHVDIAWVLILACVFGAFYAFQQAYSVMVFFITLIVALLYGMLGQFRPELLLLRLEETGVGSAIGALVTFFVLPVHNDASLREAADAFLAALADLVGKIGQENAMRGAVNDLQLKTQALRSAIGPVKRGWAMLSPPKHRLVVHAAMYCAFLARELSLRGQLSTEAKRAVLDRIEALRAQLDGRDPPTCAPRSDGPEPAAALCRALSRFGQRLEQL